jgi:NADH dehydrogenase [ubiquinone] 1 alpha subcomplex assembly factor 5
MEASVPIVFDPRAVRLHRARAAGRKPAVDFLTVEAAERLAERLEVVTRQFPMALDLGCFTGALARALALAPGLRGGIGRLVSSDTALACARRAERDAVVADFETLPFKDGAFDLVLSNLALHWTNDLPGALVQIRRILQPDGLLLATLWGGETLWELRRALMEAELEEEGGASPRVSPFADIRDLGALLQRAGFSLPVVDGDLIEVTYADPLALMRELRFMGESNAVAERRKGFSRRATLFRAADHYRDKFARADGRIPATFQLVTLTAWAPHESQPKPLRPGSAAQRLADALGTKERPAGDKATP